MCVAPIAIAIAWPGRGGGESAGSRVASSFSRAMRWDSIGSDMLCPQEIWVANPQQQLMAGRGDDDEEEAAEAEAGVATEPELLFAVGFHVVCCAPGVLLGIVLEMRFFVWGCI